MGARVASRATSAPGRELWHGEDVAAPTAVNGARADLVGTTGTFVVPPDGRPVHATFGGYLRTNAVNGQGVLQLVIDGVDVGNASIAHTSATANAGTFVSTRKRLTLTPGSHTVKVVLIGFHATGASTAKGDAGSPSFVSIVTA